MTKSAFASFLLIVASVLAIAPAHAQSKFVTDNFDVMLRTGPSIQNRIVRSLPSGTPIEVLRQDAGSGHSQVKTTAGEIGYMLTRFISDTPPARNAVASLEQQLAKLRANPSDIQTELLSSQEENQQLIAENVRLTDLAHELKTELDKIKNASGGVIKLSEKNQRLEAEVQQLLLQLDDIRIQNEALKDNSERVRNLIGVGVLLIGLFLGWVLSIAGRRERNSWGS